jgi:peptide/nickel transport system substrate-binding protein
MLRSKFIAASAFALTLATAACAQAADLVIGLKGATTSMDPHFMTSPNNWTVNTHIFEPLVKRDVNSKPEPWLADSWKIIDDVTWEFKLKPNVRFSDGSPFTAEDVIFSYQRAPNVPNAPTSFKPYVREIKTMEVVDPLTVRVTTHAPSPSLLDNMAFILIVSKKHAEKATTEDFNSGKAMIGTGAYLFDSFKINDEVTLKANPNFRDGKEPWDNVRLRVITNDSSRLAAFMAGDLDLIETVTAQDAERVKNDSRFTLISKPSTRVSWFYLNVGNEVLSKGSSYMSDTDGKPLTKNPLADPRVREALKLAIDTDAMMRVLYQGNAVSTGQYVLPGAHGYNPDLKTWKADPAKARALLTEAGWAGKFKLTFVTYDTSFPSAVKATEAIAQAWTRAGVQTSVTNLPYAVFTRQGEAGEVPAAIASYANSPGSPDLIMTAYVHSRKSDQSMGSYNRSTFVNPELDKLIEDAARTMDMKKNSEIYQRAQKVAVDDGIFVPLFFIGEITGVKKSLSFVARADRHIYAMNIRPAQPQR